MDSEQIEKILNESFPSDEPEGMRERVLRKAVSELRPMKPRWHQTAKLAFAGALALLILFANISDNSRRTRLAGSYTNSDRFYTTGRSGAVENVLSLTREAMAWADGGTDLRKVKDRL